MSGTKYVIGKIQCAGGYREIAVMFPDTLVHGDVAEGVFGRSENVLSAGTVHFDSMRRCYIAGGDSYSLKLKSRPQDSDILNRQMGIVPNYHSTQDIVYHVPKGPQ